MNVDLVWLATLATIVLLFGYEAVVAVAQRRRPDRMARSAHAALREDWLGLMGTVTLAAPSLHVSFGEAAALPSFTPRLVLELLLLTLLFASLVCSAMAVRYYNHAGFISGMPVESEARQRWAPAGAADVRRAGLLYSWGLRHLILVAPILASLLHPFAGPVAAVLVVVVLSGFDRFGAR